MNEKRIFAERLKEARLKANLSQAELSRRTKISAATLSTYESTESPKSPPIDKAAAIAHELNVSLDWLCGMQLKATSTEDDFTNFSAITFFKSLIIVLSEMSVKLQKTETDFDINTALFFEDDAIANFAEKVSDVLKIYRAGTLSEELCSTCIAKLLSDMIEYETIGNRVLKETDYQEVKSYILNHILENKIDKSGVINTMIDYYDGTCKSVSLFISPKALSEFSKEASEYGEHNTPKE